MLNTKRLTKIQRYRQQRKREKNVIRANVKQTTLTNKHNKELSKQKANISKKEKYESQKQLRNCI